MNWAKKLDAVDKAAAWTVAATMGEGMFTRHAELK